MIIKDGRQEIVDNFSQESFSEGSSESSSVMERARHLGPRLKGMISVLSLTQMLNGFAPKEATALEIAQAPAAPANVAEVVVDSAAATSTSGRADIEFKEDLVTAHFGTKISQGKMSYEIETVRQTGQTEFMSEFFRVGHGPFNIYLRSNNTEEHAVGFDISADRLGRLTNVYMIPAWVHLDSSGDVLGYTFMAKAKADLGSAALSGAVDYEARNKNALSEKDTHAEYLAVTGKSIGASIGRDYGKTVRAYVGLGSDSSFGGLLKLEYQPGQENEPGSRRATLTLCQNSVSGVIDAQGVISSQDIHTIGEFIENPTHLKDDWALTNGGLVGTLSAERKSGVEAISSSVGFNFGGKSQVGIGAGATISPDSNIKWLFGASAHPWSSVFAEGAIGSDGGRLFISRPF